MAPAGTSTVRPASSSRCPSAARPANPEVQPLAGERTDRPNTVHAPVAAPGTVVAMRTYGPSTNSLTGKWARRLTPALVRLQALEVPPRGDDAPRLVLACSALTPALNTIAPLAKVSVFSWGVRIEARWWPLGLLMGSWQARYDELAEVRSARFGKSAETGWVRLSRKDGTEPALCGTRQRDGLLEAIRAAGGPVAGEAVRVSWLDPAEDLGVEVA